MNSGHRLAISQVDWKQEVNQKQEVRLEMINQKTGGELEAGGESENER